MLPSRAKPHTIVIRAHSHIQQQEVNVLIHLLTVTSIDAFCMKIT